MSYAAALVTDNDTVKRHQVDFGLFLCCRIPPWFVFNRSHLVWKEKSVIYQFISPEKRQISTVNFKPPWVFILRNLMENSFILKEVEHLVREERKIHRLLNNKKREIDLCFISPAVTYGFRGTSEWKFTRAHLQPGGLMRTTRCLPYSSRCQLGTVESHSRLSWADKKERGGKKGEESFRRELNSAVHLTTVCK